MGRQALTTEDWTAKAKSCHGSRYDYSRSVYRGYGEQIEILCPEHGAFWQRENNHRNGAGCSKCGVSARKSARSHSYDSFVKAAREVHGDNYDYPEVEVHNSRTRVLIVCPEHGPFEQVVYVHLGGHGCAECSYQKAGKRSQLGLSEFFRRAHEVHGDTYEYLSGLNGMHKPMLIRCPLHGEFKQTPSNHLKGAGCPKCVGRVSKAEQEIAEFVSSLGVSVEQSVFSVIPPYEVDLYCPNQQVAIEYNGLWWHRDDLVGDKTRKKWELADVAGVILVQVFEDEWRDQRDQVKARLQAMLGVSESVYARQCSVCRPSKSEARQFLKSIHTQGAGAALNRVYGLMHQGRLVAVSTFGVGRYNNAGWELLRYASVGRVVGGISKLIAAFRADNEGPIVSYADLRWGSGESYRAAGFRLEKITEPDYWWVDPKTASRIPRYTLQPQKTGMPEKEYAAKHKLYRVSGVGHKKWVLDP